MPEDLAVPEQTAGGPIRRGAARRLNAASRDSVSELNASVGRQSQRINEGFVSTAAAVNSAREDVLTRLTEFDNGNTSRLGDVSQRIQAVEVGFQALENRVAGHFQEQGNGFAAALETQNQEISNKFQEFDDRNQGRLNGLSGSIEQQMQQILAAIDEIKAQQHGLTENIGRLTESTARALNITQELANRAADSERRAQETHTEARTTLIEIRAERDTISELVRTLADRQAATLYDVGQSIRQPQRLTLPETSATNPRHVAQMVERLDRMHVDSDDLPSTSRSAGPIVQAGREVAPQSFTMDTTVKLTVPADKVEEVMALGARELDDQFRLGQMWYSAPPGTDLAPLQKYWSTSSRSTINKCIAERVGQQLPGANCSFVRADAAASMGLDVPKEGLLIWTKERPWATLSVPADRADAAKALGIGEYPDKFKGGLRYTVPPGTDLMPLKEYWSEPIKREYNRPNQRERTLGTR
jgi:hypothetical protein